MSTTPPFKINLGTQMGIQVVNNTQVSVYLDKIRDQNVFNLKLTINEKDYTSLVYYPQSDTELSDQVAFEIFHTLKLNQVSTH